MQVITTTELRTKSKELVKTLKEGRSVDLIHRSKAVYQDNNSGNSHPFCQTNP